MVIIYVNFIYNKWFMTSKVGRPKLDLGCCATERESERGLGERGREGEKQVLIT
jgi:hypothetical protein